MVGSGTPGPCSPPIVCCHASSAALAAFRIIQSCRGSVFVIKGAEVEVAVSITAARRVSRGCFGRRPGLRLGSLLGCAGLL